MGMLVMKKILGITIYTLSIASLFSPPVNASDYLLGTGDLIRIKVHNITGYDSELVVMPNGLITPARIKPVYIPGQSIAEATQTISNAYRKLFKKPVLTIELLKPRNPVVYIAGAVINPGVYTLDAGIGPTPNAWPRISDIIQLAGGIDNNADLSKVELRRPNRDGKAHKTIITNLDIASRTLPHISNIELRDNDRIFVPTQDSSDSALIITNDYSNLSPKKIEILIVGEVKSPGTLSLRPHTGIKTAVSSAGDRTNRASQEILLIRTKGDFVESELLTSWNKVKHTPLGSPGNPILESGDLIIVGKNAIAKVTDTLRTSLEPLRPIIDGAALFRIFGL